MNPSFLLSWLLLLLAAPSAAQSNEDVIRISDSFSAAMRSEQASAEFIHDELDLSISRRVPIDVLSERMAGFRAELKGMQLDDIFPVGQLRMGLGFSSPAGAGKTLIVGLTERAPAKVFDLWFEGGLRLDPQAVVQPLPPQLSWDNFDERMRAEVQAGFAGAILIRRGDKIVLDKAYGLANRETGLACTPETVFATGSVPIDYTKAGILMLLDEELIEINQPISDFFSDCPADKKAITIGHLMNSSSGLPNFHGLPTDANPDHFWIDRDEAVRRILARELLFAPGTGRSHSHSAWGLLAAIIEIASDQSYAEFTRTRLFEPAGMLDTGFNGDPIDKKRLALGYGILSDGVTNAPPYWGKTSWLVQGSGGMVSTTADMLRWQLALREGRVLSPKALRRYWSGPGVLAAGDAFGFEVNYCEEQGRQFVLLSNAVDGPMRLRFQRLGREISKLP